MLLLIGLLNISQGLPAHANKHQIKVIRPMICTVQEIYTKERLKLKLNIFTIAEVYFIWEDRLLLKIGIIIMWNPPEKCIKIELTKSMKLIKTAAVIEEQQQQHGGFNILSDINTSYLFGFLPNPEFNLQNKTSKLWKIENSNSLTPWTCKSLRQKKNETKIVLVFFVSWITIINM